jgi:hypothetical protein
LLSKADTVVYQHPLLFFLLQIREKEIEKKDKSMLLSAFLCAGKSFFIEVLEETGGNRTKTAPK